MISADPARTEGLPSIWCRIRTWDQIYLNQGRRWGGSPSLLARKVKSHLELLDPGQMLEIGCGYGRDTRALRKWLPTAEIDVIEPASTGLHLDSTLQMEVRHASEGDILTEIRERPDVAYDCIYANYVLHLLFDDEFMEVFDGLRHWLAPGGTMCFNVIAKGDPTVNKSSANAPGQSSVEIASGIWWNAFSRDRLEAVLTQTGWHILRSGSYKESMLANGSRHEAYAHWAIAKVVNA